MLFDAVMLSCIYEYLPNEDTIQLSMVDKYTRNIFMENLDITSSKLSEKINYMSKKDINNYVVFSKFVSKVDEPEVIAKALLNNDYSKHDVGFKNLVEEYTIDINSIDGDAYERNKQYYRRANKKVNNCICYSFWKLCAASILLTLYSGTVFLRVYFGHSKKMIGYWNILGEISGDISSAVLIFMVVGKIYQESNNSLFKKMSHVLSALSIMTFVAFNIIFISLTFFDVKINKSHYILPYICFQMARGMHMLVLVDTIGLVVIIIALPCVCVIMSFILVLLIIVMSLFIADVFIRSMIENRLYIPHIYNMMKLIGKYCYYFIRSYV
jgi:hypothetical protein